MAERLQKILAHAGVASRREAERLIRAGRVSVNGNVVRQMGVTADAASDRITVDGQPLPPPGRPVYILLNKPRNVMSTVHDPGGRPTVLDCIGNASRERLYPAGRLDFLSEGLLILTNDGEFTRFMTAAGRVPKVYRVKVSGTPEPAALDRLRRGTRFDGERLAPCGIEPVKTGPNMWFEVTLRQGRNRQVRRMFESIGHRVMKLRRTRIGFLEGGDLKPGSWRHLTAAEVARFYDRYGKASTPSPQRSRRGDRRARAVREPGGAG